MKTLISKTAIFAFATFLATGYALAATQYSNSTEYAKTHTDWFDADVWNHATGTPDIPNWTSYPTEDENACYLDFFYDLDIGDGVTARNVTVQTIFTKVDGSTLTVNSGSTFTVTNGVNNDRAAIFQVNEDATLDIYSSSRVIANIDGGTFTTSAFSGNNTTYGKITLNSGKVENKGGTSYSNLDIKGGTFSNAGSFNYVNLTQSAGTLTNAGGTSNSSFNISGGEYVTGGSFANTSINMTGGTLRVDQGKGINLQQNSVLTLNGGVFKGTGVKTENVTFDASTINFGGGKINTFNQIAFQNGAKINFGYTDEDGVFHAAGAHSIYADWKLNIQKSDWKFNAANSNLITSNTDADLKTNAFAYAATEFQFYWDRGSDPNNNPLPDANPKNFTLDFTNLDLTAVETGTYYLSLIACEINFHSYAEPTFDFITEEGTSQLIAMSTEYDYNDNLSFQVLKNSSNTAYYVQLNITQVPEPSTYAAIFGALALGFVAYRKKRA